jgi:hypothetical protein
LNLPEIEFGEEQSKMLGKDRFDGCGIRHAEVRMHTTS